MRRQYQSSFLCVVGACVVNLLLSTTTALGFQAAEEEEPGGDERFVVVKARKVITAAGEDIPNGVIVIVNGRVRSVGKGLDYPGNAKVIDAHDQVVMPGLINPNSRWGLTPYSRRGVHADLSAGDELYRDEHTFDEPLDAGYTALALYPDGEGVPGRAMVVRTAGKAEDWTLASPSYVWITNGKAPLRDGLKRAKEELEKVEKARKEAEEKAKATSQPASQPGGAPAGQPASRPSGSQPQAGGGSQPASQPAANLPKVDAAHQALADLIQKKEGMFALIELGNGADYLHAASVLKTYEIAHAFRLRYGPQPDFHHVAHEMGSHKARVVMQPAINTIPNSSERLHLVREFSDAGCEVSLSPFNETQRGYEEMFGRLAELVRRGWGREEALKSVTLHPAKLLGLEKRIGSIEKGKDADLVFVDGDPLEPYARVRRVMVRGEIVHAVKGEVK